MSRARRAKIETHIALVVPAMRRHALASTWDGRRRPETDPYFLSCVRDDGVTGMRLILTRDVGHHTSGWFKNPDYERCWHLSMSSRVPTDGQPVGTLDRAMARLWARAIYGDALNRVWIEPAATPEGRQMDLEHWRLFCDEHWQPIMPRGEVYSLEFTEKGWKSYSQVRAETGVVITSPLNPYAE